VNQTFYLPRNTTWHSLHPLTKLAVALTLIVASFTLRWYFASVVLFILVVLPIAFWAQIARELIRTTFFVVLPIAISLALVQGFFYPGATDVIFQIGPFALKREGLEFAFATVSRLVLIAGAGLLVLYSTHPADLALALVQIGAPYPLAYILVTTIQLLPEMQAQSEGILKAQQARGLETQGNLRVRIAAFIPLISPLVYGALETVQERALALDARAFRAPVTKTSWRVLQDSGVQRISRLILVILSVLLIISFFAISFLRDNFVTVQ
jgi:energy-coupling factor transport system permease protein